MPYKLPRISRHWTLTQLDLLDDHGLAFRSCTCLHASIEVLGAAPNNDNSLFVTIPQNTLYHIVIEDAGGQGGDYTAAFEASPKVSFALDPNYFMIGRLPEGSLLYYTYTAPGGATLQGNVIPHPDTPVDLVVKILDLESRATLFEANESGPGENEQFTFSIPLLLPPTH